MTSLLLPVWVVLSWFVQHCSGLYCIVLHLYSGYQTFISLSSYAGYYWQRVHCTMHQMYTGKLLLATILDFFFFFFGSAVRLQHLYLLLCMGLGLKMQKDKHTFRNRNLELLLSTPVLDWDDAEWDQMCHTNIWYCPKYLLCRWVFIHIRKHIVSIGPHPLVNQE